MMDQAADLAAIRAALEVVKPVPAALHEARTQLWDRYRIGFDLTDDTDLHMAGWLLVLQDAQTHLAVLAAQLEDAICGREEVVK